MISAILLGLILWLVLSRERRFARRFNPVIDQLQTQLADLQRQLQRDDVPALLDASPEEQVTYLDGLYRR